MLQDERHTPTFVLLDGEMTRYRAHKLQSVTVCAPCLNANYVLYASLQYSQHQYSIIERYNVVLIIHVFFC